MYYIIHIYYMSAVFLPDSGKRRVAGSARANAVTLRGNVI